MNKDRLLAVANHLKTGILGHSEFNFSVINGFRVKTSDTFSYTQELIRYGYNEESTKPEIELLTPDKPRCGTLGCAVGELPFIFPEEWEFDKNYYLHFKDADDSEHLWEDIEKFFDIKPIESSHLFIPDEQHLYDKDYLSESATKEEVADNILHFIEMKELEGE